jgi:hypothetical protein
MIGVGGVFFEHAAVASKLVLTDNTGKLFGIELRVSLSRTQLHNVRTVQCQQPTNVLPEESGTKCRSKISLVKLIKPGRMTQPS